MRTVFLRVLDADDKATALFNAVHGLEVGTQGQRYDVETSALSVIPGTPFAYWLSPSMRAVFSQFHPVEHGERRVRQGLGTANDFRFVRLWWEVNRKLNDSWFTFVRGGRTSSFYGDVDSILNWRADGHELKAWATISTGGAHWSKNIRSTELYFKPGLTWPLRAPRFAPYPMPSESIFSIRGYACIAPRSELLATLGLFSSSVFDYLFKVLLGRNGYPEFVVGVLQKLPIPAEAPAALAGLSSRAWALRRSIDARNETSHAFTVPALLQVAGPDVGTRARMWSEHVCATDAELAGIQARVDEQSFALYGVDGADRHAITQSISTSTVEAPATDGQDDLEDAGGDGTDEDPSASDATSLAAELVSWALGVALGRFDVRLATGVRPMPTHADPFESLPACSPGMLAGADGLPPSCAPAGYPVSIPAIGVLIDEPGHVLDITAAVRVVFDRVFGGEADRWWGDVAALLEPKGHDLRVWFAKGFFEHHLKRYSKSRRKAPIYWQLSTPSNRYSVWLYAPRLTLDTLFQLQNEIVGPKLAHEERQLANAVQAAGGSPSASERELITAQEAVVAELHEMFDEVKRVAPLWGGNLDDGVALTMAPLWRLVRQHKLWQKELKGKWAELSSGKYDWAHLPMRLWPERVVLKCSEDRSIAIAHRLDDVFWVLDFGDKWRVLGEPTKERDHVRDHWTSSVRRDLVLLAQDLWETRYRDTERNDRDWYKETKNGVNDDHPIALRLWPRRVCEQAIDHPSLVAAHGLQLPRLSAADPALAVLQRTHWLERMASRFGVDAADRDFVDETFHSCEPVESWRAWWEHLERGGLDHLVVARYARSAEVVEQCRLSIEFAKDHEVDRFFFVNTGKGVRPRMGPKGELARELSERASPAVKAALNSLLDPPTAPGSRRSRGRRSTTR